MRSARGELECDGSIAIARWMSSICSGRPQRRQLVAIVAAGRNTARPVGAAVAVRRTAPGGSSESESGTATPSPAYGGNSLASGARETPDAEGADAPPRRSVPFANAATEVRPCR